MISRVFINVTAAFLLCLGMSFAGSVAVRTTEHLKTAVDPKVLEKALEHLDLPFDLKPSALNFDHLNLLEVPVKGASSVWFIENQDVQIVTFSLLLRHSGSAFEPKDKRGLQLLLVHMLDEGAGEYRRDAFKKLLIEHHIKLTVVPDNDTLMLGFSVPKASVEKAFQALKLILSSLRFDEEELKKVKGQLLVQLHQLLENEEQKAEETLKKHLMHDHPYVVTIKDQIDNISHISSKDLSDFTKKNWTKDRIIMAAVGNITQNQLQAYVKDMLSPLPEKGEEVRLSPVTFFDLGKRTHVTLDVPQTIVRFAQKGITRQHPDYFAHELALEILGSGDLGCRLMKRIREEKGLVYGIGASLLIQEYGQLITGMTSTRTQTVEEVITLIKDEWKNLIERGVSEKELSHAKKRMNGLFLMRLDNTIGLTRTLIGMQYHNLGKDYLTKRAQKINDVTLDQMNDVIKKHFSLEDLTFVTVGRGND